MINNHKELVWCAARLLARWRCSPVLTELVTCNQTGEVPDAIGWTSWCSILGASVTAEVFWHPDGMWSPMTILQEHLLIPVGKDGSEKYENRCSGFTVIGNKYENPQLLDDVLPRE